MGRMTKRRTAGSHASWKPPLLQRLHPKADHQECLHALSKDPAFLICFRLAQLARVKKLGAELVADQALASAVAARTAQTRGGVANPFVHRGYGHPVTVLRRDARYNKKAHTSPSFEPSMSGRNQAHARYGAVVQVMPSFDLAQGTRYRRIDDRSASGVNQMAHKLRKVPVTMVDYIGVMLEALAAQPASIKLATEDMKPEYRQIALHPAAVRFAITALCI